MEDSSKGGGSLGGLDDFARTDAGGASIERLVDTIDDGPHAAQVGVPTSLGHVMRVADVISVLGSFSAQIAPASHIPTSLDLKIEVYSSFILPNPRHFAH